jgi:hypothetical protein
MGLVCECDKIPIELFRPTLKSEKHILYICRNHYVWETRKKIQEKRTLNSTYWVNYDSFGADIIRDAVCRVLPYLHIPNLIPIDIVKYSGRWIRECDMGDCEFVPRGISNRLLQHEVLIRFYGKNYAVYRARDFLEAYINDYETSSRLYPYMVLITKMFRTISDRLNMKKSHKAIVEKALKMHEQYKDKEGLHLATAMLYILKNIDSSI